MIPLGATGPLRRHPLSGGSPRHFAVACSKDCGWSGYRTADKADDVTEGRPCPRCRALVKVTAP